MELSTRSRDHLKSSVIVRWRAVRTLLKVLQDWRCCVLFLPVSFVTSSFSDFRWYVLSDPFLQSLCCSSYIPASTLARIFINNIAIGGDRENIFDGGWKHVLRFEEDSQLYGAETILDRTRYLFAKRIRSFSDVREVKCDRTFVWSKTFRIISMA